MLDDNDKSLFLVSKGVCIVTFGDDEIDYNSLSEYGHHALSQGDIFGEISLQFNCKRTANVISSKFSTLARLS